MASPLGSNAVNSNAGFVSTCFSGMDDPNRSVRLVLPFQPRHLSREYDTAMSTILHLLPSLVTATTLGIGPLGTADEGSASPAGPTPPTTSPRLLREMPVLGIGINANHISDLPLYLQSVDAIAEVGANTLLLVTPMFQDKVDSSEIRFDPQKCPTREQLTAILNRARGHGLQTVLLPIVLIEFPGEKDWRGTLRPDDLDAWWASYDRFVDYYLDIAVAAGVDVFSVSLRGEKLQFQRLIQRLKENIITTLLVDNLEDLA